MKRFKNVKDFNYYLIDNNDYSLSENLTDQIGKFCDYEIITFEDEDFVDREFIRFVIINDKIYGISEIYDELICLDDDDYVKNQLKVRVI